MPITPTMRRQRSEWDGRSRNSTSRGSRNQVPPEDLHGYRQVKSALRIPIAGGEAEFTRWGFRPILVDRAIDILQPDVCAAGGLSECKKIADMASAFGVRVNPHVWGTGVGLAASLQLIAILPDNPPGLLELDQSEHPI